MKRYFASWDKSANGDDDDEQEIKIAIQNSFILLQQLLWASLELQWRETLRIKFKELKEKEIKAALVLPKDFMKK